MFRILASALLLATLAGCASLQGLTEETFVEDEIVVVHDKVTGKAKFRAPKNRVIALGGREEVITVRGVGTVVGYADGLAYGPFAVDD